MTALTLLTGLGIVVGLFFGELVKPLEVIGQIFIGLLQMTVLPYILVSLIAGNQPGTWITKE